MNDGGEARGGDACGLGYALAGMLCGELAEPIAESLFVVEGMAGGEERGRFRVVWHIEPAVNK